MGIRTSPWKRESSGSHKIITRRGVYRTGSSGSLKESPPDKFSSERPARGAKVDTCPAMIRVVDPTDCSKSRLIRNPLHVERERKRQEAAAKRALKGLGVELLAFA